VKEMFPSKLFSDLREWSELELASDPSQAISGTRNRIWCTRRQCGQSGCFLIPFDLWFMPVESLHSSATESRARIAFNHNKVLRNWVCLVPTQLLQETLHHFLLTQVLGVKKQSNYRQEHCPPAKALSSEHKVEAKRICRTEEKCVCLTDKRYSSYNRNALWE
jgi:hypothetical protein